MAWTFEAAEAGYANMWKTATLKGGADATQAETFSNKIIAAEARYKGVQAAVGVPWYFIGALHMRESGCDFSTHLHNGDPLTARTTHVPAGRPASGSPPFTWEASAIDALQMKDLQSVPSWSVARMLYESERYNGWGYVGHGENSPYVWAGTNHEQIGKYDYDGHYNENLDDPQLGVAAVLIRLAQKRPDIAAALYPATPEKPPVTDDQILAAINGLRTDIAAIATALKVPATPPVVPPVTPPVVPPTSILDSAGKSLGIAGLIGAALGQWGGGIDVTQTGSWGQLLPIIATSLIGSGATGQLSGLGNIVSTIISAFTQKKS